MNHGLADTSVGAADADILIGTAKAPHHMAFEMGKHKHGIVLGLMATYGHFRKPFASLHRKHGGAFFVHNIHRCKGPAVHFQRFPMLFRSIAVSVIIGIGFHNGGIGDFLLHQFLHPGTGNDIGAMLLSRMKLHRHFAGEVLFDFLIQADKSLCR